MLYALHGTNWIRRIQIRCVRCVSPNKKMRDTFLLLNRSESAALSSAQYLETPEGAARPDCLIVAPRKDRFRKGVGRRLPRTFAGENTIADRHTEFGGLGCIPGRDINFDISQMLLLLLNPSQQVENLPTDMSLLIGVNGAQQIELSDFGVDVDLFNDGRIARGDCLDLRIGERAALKILGRPDRGFSPHHLLDEAGLGFERLPHVSVE